MMKEINFLKPRSGNTVIVTGIVLSLSASALMVGVMLTQGSGHISTATIGDMLGNQTPEVSSANYPAAPQTAKQLTDTAISSPALGPTGHTVRYFEALTGRAFEVDLQSNQVAVVSDQKLPNFLGSVWSPDGQGVATSFSSTPGTILRYSNYRTGNTQQIGASILSAAFSPNSQQLVYAQPGVDHTTLYTRALDGSAPHILINTRATNIQLSWPQDGVIALSSQDNQKGSNLILLGLDGSFTPLLSDLTNLEYTWSPDGSKLLYSYFQNEKGIQLWYLDLVQGTNTALLIPTSAQKCAWHLDETAITCGVPSNTTLSRDVTAANSATNDDVITINLLSGEQHKDYGAHPGASIGVIHPLMSSSGSFFVFTNLFDRKLYRLSY